MSQPSSRTAVCSALLTASALAPCTRGSAGLRWIMVSPIALVTSMDEDGLLNAAPFTSYNYLCTDPPIVGMGVTNRAGEKWAPKDTARNIRRTGEYVINVVTEDLVFPDPSQQ